MMSERRISPGEINRYLSDINREINDLEQKLSSLRAASGAVRAAATGSGGAAAAGAAPAKAGGGAKRRAKITPEQLASRQLQGRYLGLIRQIPANKRGQYQRTAKEKGREAAIKEMQESLKK